MELTPEQSAEIPSEPEAIVDVIDPATNRKLLIVDAAAYTRMKEELEDKRFTAGLLRAAKRGLVAKLNEEP